MLGGEYAVRLLNYFALFCGLILLENHIKRNFGKIVSLYSVLILITTPFLLWSLGIVFIDTYSFFASCVIFVYFLSIYKKIRVVDIYTFFIFLACCILFKLQLVFICFPLGLLMLFYTLKQYKKRLGFIFIRIIVGLSVFLLILLPVLLHNYILSGNPIFPFFNGIFKSPYSTITNFTSPLINSLTWRSLYDITFNGGKYIPNINFSFGIYYLIFLPFIFMIFCFGKTSKSIFTILFIFIIAILLWFKLTCGEIRYFIVLLPIGSLLIALIMGNIYNLGKKNIFYRYIINIIFCIIIFINFLCQQKIVNFIAYYPIREAITRETLTSCNLWLNLEFKKTFTYASTKFGNNSKGLVLSYPFYYFADFNMLTNQWYNNNFAAELIKYLKSEKDLYDYIFNKEGFDFIIMPDILNPPWKIFETVTFRARLHEVYHNRIGVGVYVPKVLEKDIDK